MKTMTEFRCGDAAKENGRPRPFQRSRNGRGRPYSFFFAALGLLLAGCDNMGDQPQRELAAQPTPDRHRPAHTVARGETAPTDPFVTGFIGTTPLAHSPLPFTSELLARGRDRFEIYCAVCHGSDGYGQGIVVRRGFPTPPSYHQDRLREAPDGHLFDVMTRGFGVMLPYSDRLTPRDRWAIVGYIRALQRSQHATLADVPDSERTQLTR